MEETARALVAPGKGILAADESDNTIAKRFAAINVDSTAQNHRIYRQLLFTTPGVEKFISGVILFDETIRHRLIRRLIGIEVTDLLHTTQARLEESGVDSVEALQLLPLNVVGFSDALARLNRELKDFLFKNMYQHFRVFRMQVKAERFLEDLFEAYTRNPETLPHEIQERAREGDLYRTVCDYIAGMTDRFALEERDKLFDPHKRP